MLLKDKLSKLYNDQSKHANYQNIPDFVKKDLDYQEQVNETWRGDRARYEYIVHAVDFAKGIKVADIGANTGFFTLSLAHDNHQSTFFAYEPHEQHACFIETIVNHYKMQNVFTICQSIGLREIRDLPNYDVIFLLNVLHHAGVDYDSDLLASKDGIFEYLVNYLSKLKAKTDILILQIGYNWGGNKQQPIVPVNQIPEMLYFMKEVYARAKWRIKHIAIYARDGECGKYHDLADDVIKSLCLMEDKKSFFQLVETGLNNIDATQNSEFYNRPIFILENR
jgi:hypothetical protein